ncbi:hypothetical protein [uncultured Thiocystis sp.]|jgi:hypothetical protein|uniref:type III secretion apparatus assembly protein SctX n=1 Tax=uncultured Thiocystis sp. TaxID=1202134 RepID=UPI002600CAD8|nr:hypothetical protein [uncultured Thiocystis sp.]
MDYKIGGFSLDLGLETIARLDGADTNLPAQCETQLTGGPIRHWIGELFRPGTFDQQLRRFARAEVQDPALLAPAHFEALVRDSAVMLNDLATREHDPDLAAAAALLAGEVELRDLLANYRTLLLRA